MTSSLFEDRIGVPMDELALRCGVSVSMIRKLVYNRTLASFKIGRRRVIDAASAEAYLKRQRTGGAT